VVEFSSMLLMAALGGGLLGKFSRLFPVHGDTPVDSPAFAVFMVNRLARSCGFLVGAPRSYGLGLDGGNRKGVAVYENT